MFWKKKKVELKPVEDEHYIGSENVFPGSEYGFPVKDTDMSYRVSAIGLTKSQAVKILRLVEHWDCKVGMWNDNNKKQVKNDRSKFSDEQL